MLHDEEEHFSFQLQSLKLLSFSNETKIFMLHDDDDFKDFHLKV